MARSSTPSPIANAPSLVRYTGGEWSVLYQDGVLVRIGDRCVIDEYLESLLGVTVIYDEFDSVFLGRECRYDNAAESLAEVTQFSEGGSD